MSNVNTMGKEASLDGLEFDGETVLCRVCGDKASGFHYGVHACEGCKGFFRRSIQQKIQYRPCLKNQQCNIMRVNRNRCQYCRLKKCIAVGMSRDAVRFGRVPKKEKARIIEQMQKVNLQTVSTQLSSVLLNTQDLVQAVILAHRQTFDLSLEKARLMRESALQSNDYVDCPAHMACPLNVHLGPESADNQEWKDFSEFFAPAIKSVVDFAKLIPGFLLLNQDDQVTLLKAATFEVLLVRLACLFDSDSNTMMFLSGRLFKRQTTGMTNSVGFLLDSMFDFAERFNKLSLSNEEIALFSAVVLLSPDRPGLRNVEQVENILTKLTESLQNMINANHKEDSMLFAKLLMKTTDLRTLNALHSEKSIGCQADEKDGPEQSMDSLDLQNDAGSECSGPSDASSNMTVNSLSQDSGCYDSNGSLLSQRLQSDLTHQQVVLKTPYGTFYREDNCGYYGMVHEQPRRRCNTLDRDSLVRPRLHTIEESNRRRYTLDRDYLKNMECKLGDKLEKRTAIHVRGDSMPPSLCSSATSSPIPEERYAYINANKDFIPISTPDSSACSSRTSPMFLKDTLLPFGSSPNSPRPRSGSMGADDLGPMRPRCSSFTISSDGRAARAHPYNTLDPEFCPENQHYRMAVEMRRGSVGASYGLYKHKKSLLVDRHPKYLSRVSDGFFSRPEKRSPHHLDTEANKPHTIGSGESAFNQVCKMSPPAPVSAHNWGKPIGRTEVTPEPPVVSITAPQEDLVSMVSEREKSPHRMGAGLVLPIHPDFPKSPAGSSPVPTDVSEMEEQKEDNGDDEQEMGVFHKKFDKMRKHMIQHSKSDDGSETVTEESETGLQLLQESAKNQAEKENHTGESMEMSIEEEEAAKDSMREKPKLSAGEAHPQLLAHLKAAPVYASSTYTQPSSIHPAFIPVSQATTGISELRIKDNVVLNVPQGPFIHQDSSASARMSHPQTQVQDPVMVSKSLTGNQSVMEQMLSRDTSQVQVLLDSSSADLRDNHATTVSYLKDKLMRKYDSMENLQKIGQEQESDITHNAQNKMTATMEVRGTNAQVPQFYNGQQIVPAFMQPGIRVDNQQTAGNIQVAASMYPQFLGEAYAQAQAQAAQAMNMLPVYNQHLAGMQQLAQFYGGAGQALQKRPEGMESGHPLNLAPQTATVMYDNSQRLDPSELDKKIKEEILS